MIERGNLREFHQCGQIQRPVDAVNFAVIFLGFAKFFVIDDQPRQFFTSAGRDFQTHRVAALTGLEPVFNQPQLVVGFLFQQFDIAVARNAERGPRLHEESAE